MTDRPRKCSRFTPSRDSERETRVLLEDVRSELKVVAEGHTSVVKHLDKVEDSLEEIKGKLEQHDLRFDKLENQFGVILMDHEHRLKALEEESN